MPERGRGSWRRLPARRGFGRSGTQAVPTRMLVPLYEYPSFFGSDWDVLPAAPAAYVIANPASGPGDSQNADWLREIDATRAGGTRVLGYVNTRDGDPPAPPLPLGTVTGDIDDWHTFYPGRVDGIFFDLLPTGFPDAGNEGFVAAICAHVRSKGAGQVATGNFGTWPLTGGYLTPLDVACVWEGHFTNNGYLASTVPGYAAAYANQPPGKLLHLVYGANEAQGFAAFRHSRELGAGWCYVADDPSGLWLSLSAYYLAQRQWRA